MQLGVGMSLPFVGRRSWVAAVLAPAVLSLVSSQTSATATYRLEFAAYGDRTPTAVRVRVGTGAWSDLLAPPPAPGISALAGNFSVTVTLTGSGSSFDLYRDGVLIHSYAGGSYTDSGLTAGQTYSYTATQTSLNGVVGPLSAAATAVPTSAPQLYQTSLVADYRFTETAGALLDLKSGYDSISMTAVTRNGKFYTSAADGTTRLPLALGLETVLNGKAGGFMGALIRFPTIPAAVSQISSISAALGLGLSTTPRLRAGVRAGGSTTLSTPAVNLSVNTWYYLAVDYNGTDLVAIINDAAQAPVAKTGTLSLAGDPYIFTTESQTSPASSLDIALMHVYDASIRANLADNYAFAQHIITERAL
jgi:hypothetical protein